MILGHKSKPITYAITGAGGFLGQHLLHLYLKDQSANNNVSFKIIDKLSTLDNLIYPEDFTNKKVKLFLGRDVAEKEQLAGLFEDVDVVIHLAATIAYGRKNQRFLYKTNVLGTQNIIKEARNNFVKKIIYVSSFATRGYLDNKNKNMLADENCENNWEKELYCHYGFSKYAGEQIAMESKHHSTEVLIAIPGIMLGPGACNYAGILPFKIASQRRLTLVPEGGTNIIDVRDVANGLIKLAEHTKASGKYLFVSHNIAHRDLLENIAGVLKKKIKPIEIPKFYRNILASFVALFEFLLPKHSILSKENINKIFSYRYFTNKKACNELNWNPKYSLEQTLQDTNNWLKKQKYE